MTDNEKLIEAKTKLAQHAMRRDLGAMPGHIRTVLDALSVFEKAHTPTDDEREALMAAIDPSSRRTVVASRAADRVTAAGFHRSVNPTNDERADAAQRWPIPMNYEVGDPEHTLLSAQRQAYMLGRSDARTRSEVPEPSACSGCHGLKGAHFSTCPEPQGEPSGAQVHAAWLEINGVITQERMRAALRAASAVTEQGENK